MSSMQKIACEDWEDYMRGRLANGKKFRDQIHGFVKLGPAAVAAVDTPQLQRLRWLRQLGCTSAVYPDADHTRFAHSLGVAHLASKMLDHLRMLQPGLELWPEDMDLVELAGLSHDAGHGPFSHAYEHEVLPRLGLQRWSHEDMSAKLIERLVDEAHLDLDAAGVRRVQQLVTSGKECGTPSGWDGREFLLQIVANAKNGVDVDKLDYLHRDSLMVGAGTVYSLSEPLIENCRAVFVDGGSQIAFKSGMAPVLNRLFMGRAEMHQTVYRHPKVKCSEYLVVDALLAAAGPLRLRERTQDPDEFLGLTDALVLEIRNSRDPGLAAAKELVQRLERREVYPFCGEADVPKERALGWKALTEAEVVAHQDHNSGVNLSAGDIRVDNLTIDLGMGGQHAASEVLLFDRVGRLEPCSDLPFAAQVPVQCKVRVYLAMRFPREAAGERAAAVRAVQAAFEAAVRARLGGGARIAWPDRAPAAPARSGVAVLCSQRGAVAAAYGQPSVQGRLAPAAPAAAVEAGGEARGPRRRRGNGGSVAAPGGSAGTTPEKLPPARRRADSPAQGDAAAPSQRHPTRLLLAEPNVGAPKASEDEQRDERGRKQEGTEEEGGQGGQLHVGAVGHAKGAAAGRGGGVRMAVDGADEHEDGEGGPLLTQESASIAVTKRSRRP